MPNLQPDKLVQNVRYGPQALDDSVAVDAGSAVMINVLANDLAGNSTTLWSLD